MGKIGVNIQYLEFNKDIHITFEALSVQVRKWFVDALFCSLRRQKEPHGGFMNLRKVFAYGTSVRHNLNTKRSAEADLAGLGNILPQVI